MGEGVHYGILTPFTRLPTWISISWKWASILTERWLGMVNVDWLYSMQSEIFLQMNFIIFQGYPTKHVAFLPGQPSRYNEFLIQLILRVQEGHFAKKFEHKAFKF